MIVDSSALVAVVRNEPEALALSTALGHAIEIGIGAPTLVETSIVLTTRVGSAGRMLLGRLLDELGVSTIPFDDRHWRVAADAFARFGKGRHPAALNFGDCMTYATARISGWPLLCIGGDFAQTDIDLVDIR